MAKLFSPYLLPLHIDGDRRTTTFICLGTEDRGYTIQMNFDTTIDSLFCECAREVLNGGRSGRSARRSAIFGFSGEDGLIGLETVDDENQDEKERGLEERSEPARSYA